MTTVACDTGPGGDGTPDILKAAFDEFSVNKLAGLCTMEWSKAVYNLRDRRVRPVTFGPCKGSEGGDDLTQVANRNAKMSFANSMVLLDCNGDETKATRALLAPPGTTPDVAELAYCRSGEFREYGRALGIGRWGVCK